MLSLLTKPTKSILVPPFFHLFEFAWMFYYFHARATCFDFAQLFPLYVNFYLF